MDIEKILQIKDPNEAMRQILLTAKDVKEVEDSVEMYANFHKIEEYEMAYYPDGENVAATVEPGSLLLQAQQTKANMTTLTTEEVKAVNNRIREIEERADRRTEEMLDRLVREQKIKKTAKNAGYIVAVVILGCLGLVSLGVSLFFIAGGTLLIYHRLEEILNIAVSVGCVAVLVRAVMVLSAIIPRKNDTQEKRGARLRTLQSAKWLAICILFLALYPIQCWLSIIHAPVPGDTTYIVDLEYSLWSTFEEDEPGWEPIDKKGIAPFKIQLRDNVEYEDYTYYSGAVELEGTRISRDSVWCVESVVLPDYGEYELFSDGEYAGEDEIEINGFCCTLQYTIGDLTEERLGYTLEDKISDITPWRKVEFVAYPIMALIAIGGFFISIRKRTSSSI